jgi:hypothetical protein
MQIEWDAGEVLKLAGVGTDSERRGREGSSASSADRRQVNRRTSLRRFASIVRWTSRPVSKRLGFFNSSHALRMGVRLPNAISPRKAGGPPDELALAIERKF